MPNKSSSQAVIVVDIGSHNIVALQQHAVSL